MLELDFFLSKQIMILLSVIAKRISFIEFYRHRVRQYFWSWFRTRDYRSCRRTPPDRREQCSSEKRLNCYFCCCYCFCRRKCCCCSSSSIDYGSSSCCYGFCFRFRGCFYCFVVVMATVGMFDWRLFDNSNRRSFVRHPSKVGMFDSDLVLLIRRTKY